MLVFIKTIHSDDINKYLKHMFGVYEFIIAYVLYLPLSDFLKLRFLIVVHKSDSTQVILD